MAYYAKCYQLAETNSIIYCQKLPYGHTPRRRVIPRNRLYRSSDIAESDACRTPAQTAAKKKQTKQAASQNGCHGFDPPGDTH